MLRETCHVQTMLQFNLLNDKQQNIFAIRNAFCGHSHTTPYTVHTILR